MVLLSLTALRARVVLKWRAVDVVLGASGRTMEGRLECSAAAAAVLKAREWASSSALRRLRSWECC